MKLRDFGFSITGITREMRFLSFFLSLRKTVFAFSFALKPSDSEQHDMNKNFKLTQQQLLVIKKNTSSYSNLMISTTTTTTTLLSNP